MGWRGLGLLAEDQGWTVQHWSSTKPRDGVVHIPSVGMADFWATLCASGNG